MTAIFTTDIKSFYASNIIKSLQITLPNLWATNTSYTIGDIVYYSNFKYIATSTGLSGATPPVHTNGIETDGNINWLYVENLIQNDSYHGSLYFFIGKSSEWLDENSPDLLKGNDNSNYNDIDDLIALKRINPSDVKLGIPRYDWTINTLYQEYNANLKSIVNPLYPNIFYTNPFYVITDELNIYKCLDNNNNSLSTIKPSGTSTGIITLSDGYVWKYLATISAQDAANSLTEQFIPVEYKNFNDGSNQWNVQQASQPRSISNFSIISQTGQFTTPLSEIQGDGTGLSVSVIKATDNTISQIIPTDSGQNYDSNTYVIIKETGVSGSGALATANLLKGAINSITLDNIGLLYSNGAIVLIEGDGTGAELSVTIGQDDSIASIDIIHGGQDYTYANLFIIAGSVGCIAKGNLSPVLGHGYNIVSELCANALIFGIRLQTNDYFITGVDSDFRKFGLIVNAKDINGNYLTEQFNMGKNHPNFLTATNVNKLQDNKGSLLYVYYSTKKERAI